MRSGIHTFLIWIIHQNSSAIFYNNIMTLDELSTRMILSTDDRIDKLTSSLLAKEPTPPAITIYSFESQYFDEKLYTQILNHVNRPIVTVIVRNPYNNLASLLAYYENGGQSEGIKHMVENKTFVKYWIQMVTFALQKKFIIILYEKFTTSEEYRKEIGENLNLNVVNNKLTHPLFGGGSSFTDTNHNSRVEKYLHHPYMQEILNIPELKILWDEINT